MKRAIWPLLAFLVALAGQPVTAQVVDMSKPATPEQDRTEAERQVRDLLGLPMMGASGSNNNVTATTAANEGEIIGTLFYAYGGIWARPGLTVDERCYISMAVLTTNNQLGPLKDIVRGCLKHGIAPEDVLEAMLQVGVYAGLSAATSGMDVARQAFVETGVAKLDDDVAVVSPMSQAERMTAFMRVAKELGIGRIGTGPDAPPLAPLKGGAWTVPSAGLLIEQDLNMINGAYGYGEVWGRKRLGYRNRSFITMAVLQTLLQNEQFHYHVNNALNLGITPDEIHEAMAQVGVYAGLSGWQNATNVARDVIVQRAKVAEAAP